MREHHVYGPPGCGKTTYITRQAHRAVEIHGSDGVMICSLTRAAAREAAGRETHIDSDRIGTLHAMCYRGLGCPKLVTAKEIDAWNRENPGYQIRTDSLTSREEGDELKQGPAGDFFQEYDLLRARCTPREEWPELVRWFADRWQAFKNEAHLFDFTDLIEKGNEELPMAPGSPRIIFCDEVQDFSRLEMKLVRGWALSCDSLVLVGDPLQALYAWRGADPQVLGSEHADSVQVLSQSYRVPQAIHTAARRITAKLPGGDIEYHPTHKPGKVQYSTYCYKYPEGFLHEIEAVVKRGERIMILAACSYILKPLLRVLRREGIPYHNPYSPTRWNPLSRYSGRSTWERLVAFLRPHLSPSASFVPEWSATEVRRWSQMLRAGVMVRGAKKRLAKLPEDMSREELDRVLLESFERQALDALFRGDLDWFVRHFTARYQTSARYPLKVMSLLGREAFLEQVKQPATQRPWVTVGTIHSVKGGEADHVLVFPDLSLQGYEQSLQPGWAGSEAIRRLFYVAYTRARQRLILGDPSCSTAVRL